MSGNVKMASSREKESQPSAYVVYIEKRALFRKCVTSCLSALYRTAYIADFSSTDDFLSGNIERSRVSSILIGINEVREHHDDLKFDLDRVAAKFPEVPIILLCDHQTGADLLVFIKMGVRGYIFSDGSLDTAVGAINVVRAGGSFIPGSYFADGGPVVQRAPVAPAQQSHFTPRQIEVLKRLHQAKATRVIAQELAISESRVKAHIRNLMEKLNAISRTQIVFMTREHFPPVQGRQAISCRDST